MENFVTALEKFFYEVIGQLLPGMFLLVGLFFVLPSDFAMGFAPTTEFEVWIFLAASYCFGAALAATGQYFFIPAYINFYQAVLYLVPRKRRDKLRVKKLLVSNDILDDRLEKGDSYRIISNRFKSVKSLRSLRNMAMSSIDAADKETTVRLMFISLLCQGLATAMLILIIVSICLVLLEAQMLWYEKLFSSTFLLVLGAAVALPFVLREREFFDRARRLPLDCYLALLKSPEDREDICLHAQRIVYLSGGHRSGWQDNSFKNIDDFTFIDPSKNGLSDAKSYTSWDLYSIDKCDIVFAYFESTNPSGYGLALEVGYAAAKGKHIILVDEKSKSDQSLSKYIKIVREASDVVFESLEEGVNYLKSLP